MERYTEPAKEIPVYGRYDVVVSGGGCAGFTAAVASARAGAKTLILEQFPFFGGTATASLMATIVGIRNQVKPDDLQVCKGIGDGVAGFSNGPGDGRQGVAVAPQGNCQTDDGFKILTL